MEMRGLRVCISRAVASRRRRIDLHSTSLSSSFFRSPTLAQRGLKTPTQREWFDLALLSSLAQLPPFVITSHHILMRLVCVPYHRLCNRFTRYLADGDGSVTIWANSSGRPSSSKRTRKETLTLDGWDWHHVVLFRAEYSSGIRTRLVVVSPDRDQLVPTFSRNRIVDEQAVAAAAALAIDARTNGVMTPTNNGESNEELDNLRAENAALKLANAQLLVC